MTDLATAHPQGQGSLIPPAPVPPKGPLPLLTFLREMSRSTIAVWGEGAYDILLSRGRRFGVDSVLVNDPAVIREVAAGDARGAYIKPVTTRRMVRPVGGAGLVLSEGAQWKRQRRLLAPLFTPSHVNLFIPHFNETADELLDGLEARGRVNLAAAFQEAALDAACRTLFSMPIGGYGRRLASLAREYVKGPGRPAVWDFIARQEGDFSLFNGGRRQFSRRWGEEVRAIIAERHRRTAADRPADLLDLLLQARDPDTGEGLSDQEIQDQTSTFIGAGFETTARLLFWTVYLLSRDPDEQARVRAEVRAFPAARVASLADLAHWPRLRQVLLETMRLYPPAPLYTRLAVEADEIGGMTIDPGTVVMISPWIVHRHRKLWDNPSAFIPDRFEGKGQDYLTNPAYIPFGAGPRICIGAAFSMTEGSVLLARFLERFEAVLDDDRPVTPVSIITTMPDVEPWFRLKRAG